MSSLTLAQLPAADDPAQAKSELLAALDQLDQALRGYSLSEVPQPPSFFERVQDFGTNWSGFLGIIFMGLLVFVLWRTLKVMPRTKPMQLKPDAGLEVGWADIAGVDEAKEELI